jgi:hypothetical protein
MTYWENKSVPVLAGVVMLVLCVGNGALTTLAGMPLVSQALQILGLLYVAELVLDSLGHRVRRYKLRMPAWSPSPTSGPETRGSAADQL